DLAAALVTHYRNEYLNNNVNPQAEMFSAIDLARMRTGTLTGAVNNLGVALDAALAAHFPAINGSVQNASETDCGCPPPSVDLILDLKNLSKEYKSRVPVAAVQAAAQSVIDEVPKVAYSYWNGSGGNNRPAGWNATRGSDYFGISIYHTNGSYDTDYNATAFAGGSFWDVYIWNFNQMMNGGPVIAPEFGSAVVAVAAMVSLPLLLSRRRRSRKGNSP
ncbi:MAG TPA: hypothetical protein VI893_09330, partial [Thermoplasmata archaeon]|nr:hypothetical protein [Thermoplasmata archaeon]